MSNRPSRKPSSSARLQQAAEQRSGPPVALLVGGAAVVVLALVLAITLSGGDGDGATTFAHGSPEVEGTPLGQHVAGAPDPAVGQAAPVVAGADFDGAPVALDGGSATLTVFLAHWCPVCQSEVPELQAWIDDGTIPDDVRVVAVATANDPGRDNFPPDAWLESEGWTPSVLVDSEDSEVAAAFGLSGFPFMVVTDADGTVVARHSGVIGEAQLTMLLDQAR
ncbi:MAG: TlpA family protein disulfide reductase [Acidimicrobiia bacterium]|nr:TlpA family protein disulfide reductase [Acidimicrobiia bacterium]